jgi:CHAT domain-containing protein
MVKMNNYDKLIYALLIVFSVTSSSFISANSDNEKEDLKKIADDYFKSSQWDSAAYYYSRAASLFLEVNSIKEYLYCKNQQAYSLGAQYKTGEALEITMSVLDQFSDSLKAIKYDVYFYWKASLFNFRLGNHIPAYDYAVKTRQSAESYGSFNGYMKNQILDLLTSSARYLGLYDLGLIYAFEKAYFNQSENDYLNLSHTYNSTGLIYKRLKNLERAKQYLIKSMELREQYAPEWTPYVMQNIAELYHENYVIDSAELWYRKTLKKLNSQVQTKNLLHSVLYGGLSKIYFAKEKYDSALVYINKCLEIRKNFESEDNSFFQNYVKEKSEILIGKKEFDQAYTILVELKEGFLNENSSPQRKVSYYQSLAFYYKEKESYQKALEEYQNAIRVISKDFDLNDIFSLPSLEDFFYGKEILLDVIVKKTRTLLEVYKQTKVINYLEAVNEHFKFAMGLMGLMINDQSSISSISGLFNQNREILNTAIESLITLFELKQEKTYLLELSNFMESSRMNHVKTYYNLHRMINLGGLPDSVFVKKQIIENRINSLEMDTLMPAEQRQEELFKLKTDLDRVNFFIKRESSKNPNTLKFLPENELSKAQKKLRKNQLLVQYFFGDSKLYCLTTSTDKHNISTIEWGQKENEILGNYLLGLKNPREKAKIDTLGQEVYKLLDLSSIIEKGVNEIIILPDRELHFIPFDALQDENGNYLIKNFTIYYQNSLIFFNRKWPGYSRNNEESYLGFAPFSSDENYAELQISEEIRNNYGPLPGSGREVEIITQYFEGRIYKGNRASETDFKKNARGTKIIHLATHTQLSDRNPMYNQILFAGNDEAEDNDGILHTFEVYPLQLNSELVTLSACNTGVGEFYDGEGVISLATGFKSAGVESIVMSLWAIPDDATSNIMERFYFHLHEGKGKAESLRQAKIDFLEASDENLSSPYYWSATILTGNNDPIRLQGKNKYLWLLTVLIFISSFVFFAIRRKKK